MQLDDLPDHREADAEAALRPVIELSACQKRSNTRGERRGDAGPSSLTVSSRAPRHAPAAPRPPAVRRN
jgi:hypothetical protein